MDTGFDLPRDRRATMPPIARPPPVAIALWFAIAYPAPMPSGRGSRLDRD